MALAHCILGKYLEVGCHCFPPPLDIPTFSARCLHVQRSKRPLAAEGGTLRGREMFRQILSRIRLPRNSRDLLHAANLRHGTDGFTSPPKKGVPRIFSALKIRRLRTGLNPRTLVPTASMLPLDHWSHYKQNMHKKLWRHWKHCSWSYVALRVRTDGENPLLPEYQAHALLEAPTLQLIYRGCQLPGIKGLKVANGAYSTLQPCRLIVPLPPRSSLNHLQRHHAPHRHEGGKEGTIQEFG
jgi:hypothetical protein